MITVYSDGACSSNGTKNAVAGWAYIILDEEQDIIAEKAGRIENGTNNIGELTAIIESLKKCKKMKITEVTLVSDSNYCVKGATEWMYNWARYGWYRDAKKTKELKNRGLWIELNELLNEINVNFEWVRGHQKGNNINEKWNNYVDKLAVEQTR